VKKNDGHEEAQPHEPFVLPIGGSPVAPATLGSRLHRGQFCQVIQTAFREVSDALVGYRKTREQRVQQALLVEALADSAALANTHFLGGIDSYLQVLDAERQLFDTELELRRVRANELLNIVQLYKALGGGWQPDQPTAGAAADTVSMVRTASQR
jgi:outer membrane protein TolC